MRLRSGSDNNSANGGRETLQGYGMDALVGVQRERKLVAVYPHRQLRGWFTGEYGWLAGEGTQAGGHGWWWWM